MRLKIINNKSTKKRLLTIYKYWVICASIAFCAVFLWSIPKLDVLSDVSYVVRYQNNEVMFVGRTQDDKFRIKTTVHDVDPLFINMLIASEDKRFYEHIGVDPIAIGRALLSDIKSGRIVSGGSTLAMQAVRSIEKPRRTLLSKIKEALGAIFLTINKGREEVLNMWLTRASFGGDTEGVTAASLRWFGHLPDHLTSEECALLVALPRAPESYRPDRHPQAASLAIKDVLSLAVKNNVISDFSAQAIDPKNLPKKMQSLPREQVGLANKLKATNEKSDITTALSPRIQRLLKNEGEHFRKTHEKNVSLAAVILNHNTHRIEGYLGSAVADDTQLSLGQAVRSPGSALKPFAYAIAFEQQLLHPKSILADEKTFFGTWAPQNYSNLFKGKVTAENALIYSLNLPALTVLSKISPDTFSSRLQNYGLVLPKGASASLALVLGGCGIRLTDLTELYAALENDGIYGKYTFLKDEKNNYKEERILSAGASRAVSEILQKSPAPLGFSKIPYLGYKTGTSWGSRDAWCIGSLGNYTVGIWCGRPDGKETAGLTGFMDATPVLYRIMQELKPEVKPKAPLDSKEQISATPPENLKDLSKQDLVDPDRLYIEFPRDGDTLSPGIFGTISLSIKGGTTPYYLSVNSIPCDDLTEIEPSRYMQTKNSPLHIDVIDSQGRGDSITVRVILP